MKVFTDSKNRKWDCSFTVATNKRVRAGLGINLISLLQDNGSKGYGELVSDEVKLTEVIYWVVKPQADAQGVDDYGFCEGFDESVLLEAEAALYEGLVDFFKDPKKREILRALRQKSNDVSRLVSEKGWPIMNREMDSINPEKIAVELIQKLESDLAAEKLKNSSSSVPASVESAPAT
jgi:hypothetical protein